jgi:hypothetical protein
VHGVVLRCVVDDWRSDGGFDEDPCLVHIKICDSKKRWVFLRLKAHLSNWRSRVLPHVEVGVQLNSHSHYIGEPRTEK